MRKLRVLIHALSLSGAGHYVRARALSAEFARVHDVVMVDAGKPLPLPLPEGVRKLLIERIRREGHALVAGNDALASEAVLARRREQLVEAAHSFRPDVLLVEHYPFSKWQLADEVDALIDAVRAANVRAQVLCTVRDLPLQTRHETCTPQAYADRVVETLNTRFDALLVHADPGLTPFESVFSGAARLRIPIRLTGIVHHVEDADSATLPAQIAGRPFVLCSVGGGTEGADLLATCRAGWRGLRSESADVPPLLVTCGGTSATAVGDDVIALPFTSDFGALLRACRLSISHAGYNTCADLLRYRVPALLVAHPSMSDQAARAEIMDRIGAAVSLDAAGLDARKLAQAMQRTLRDPPRRSLELALDGAAVARRWIEGLAEGSPAS